ncbi:MAG: hypothetical protein U0354_18185 [Candidatus Sericytochromatia bacterium]
MKKFAVLFSLFLFGCTNPTNQSTNSGNTTGNTTTGSAVSFATVKTIIDSRCASCHSMKSGKISGGISFDTNDTIVSRARQLNREVQGGDMPPQNSTSMTTEERNLINTWVSQGASTN